MKLYPKKKEDLFLPDYIIKALGNLDWVETTNESIVFHPDDFIFIHYGTRGSTSYSGPKFIRYGSNTTCFQFYSPKLPDNQVYLGDGGSGILEASNMITTKLFSRGINPFTDSREKISKALSQISMSFTHYHYDHLHLGLPLTSIAHCNNLKKYVIGSDNPKQQFKQAFRRPVFPRDFGEISNAYEFFSIADARSSVLVFLPSGEMKCMDVSSFDDICQKQNPQIKHMGVSYNIEECVASRIYPAYHPDPCNSFRYETYNSQGEVETACTFVTDHEIQESHASDIYFSKHLKGSDYVYLDGQYSMDNYIAGFGHGRVEVVAEIAARLELPYVSIGHHDPSRTDDQIDEMMAVAKKTYKEKSENPEGKLLGARDRMMVFIPGKSRQRKGLVFGRMDVDITGQVKDELGEQNKVVGAYNKSDLTTTYKTVDQTSTL